MRNQRTANVIQQNTATKKSEYPFNVCFCFNDFYYLDEIMKHQHYIDNRVVGIESGCI